MLYSTLIIVGLLFIQANAHVIDKRQQKDAVNTSKLPKLKPLAWGDVNFIHSTDTHGWLEGHVLQGSYNGDLGDFYSFVIRMKEKAKKLGKDLFIVDTGDTHDGDGLSDVTDPRVNEITIDTVDNFIPHWKDRYLCANVYLKDVQNNKTVQIGNKYTYFKGEFGTRVLAYGFLFNFKGNGDKSVITMVEDEIAKPWFKQSLKAHTPDIITLIGHIGIRFEEIRTIINAIRAYYPTIPITVLGGHTHIRDFAVYDGRAAGIESGRYMETIGFFSADGIYKPNGNITFSRRYLDQNRASYIYHSVGGKAKKFDTHVGKKISKKISKLRKKLHLSQHLGCAPKTYPLESVPVTDESSVYRLITQEVLPKTIADTNRKNVPYFLYNSGGVRYDIYQGPFTLSNMYQLSPFEDAFYRIDNVPLSTARKLLPVLNREGEMKKRSIILSQEFHQSFYTLDSSVQLTPGYVTKDDYGTDGDDTLHTPIPYYPAPAFVGSDLPKDEDDSRLVDIYYLDFFDHQLKGVLANLTGQSWTSNTTISPYTTNTVWTQYVKNYWKECPENTLFY
ncbi:hypothetical protein G6F46_008057 [Rhizopus delemar]|nr:hypothetical protein G6F54_007598 [Rhizopus delemar]KAG1509211.1 hypothetical protein G6F53_007623 [Rhizopus delemar]KAG1550834.1 hypothetical protein G6F49_009171 [Rhizopus delemar]KAG1583877.1 hypothetical protein G6F48_008239 [Rhizopus delemar]KAG1592501.1 hypothetical protein G6F47_009415 [Rhizopus delemar]